MNALCSFLAFKAITAAMHAQGATDDCRPGTVPQKPHGCFRHCLAMSSNLRLYLVYLKNEGWADGGVKGAHAIEDSVTGLQVSQEGGVGVRENLMVPLPALMPQVEDALNGGLKL